MLVPSLWSRAWLQALAVLVLSVALGAGVELGLREGLPLRDVCLEAHPERLYRAAPGCAHVYVRRPENGGEVVLNTYGAAGFRGADPAPGPRARPRVMVYGDSFVAAEYSREPDTFVARLGAHLGAEAINAGVTGYGPDQAYLRLAEEIDAYTPDLVVFSVFVGNDLGDLMRNRLFVVDARGEVVRDAPQVAVGAGAYFARSAQRDARPALVKAAEKLRVALEPSKRPDLRPGYTDRCLAARAAEWRRVQDRDLTVRSLFGDGWDAHVAVDPDGAHAQYNLRLLSHVLARVDEHLSARGVPWLLLIIPDAVDVARDYDLTFDASRHPQYAPGNLARAVRGVADAQGLRTLDATTLLTETDEPYYYRVGNSHWNARGQDRVAEAVAARIRTEGLLER